jgi:L-gulono-1,4-lactone dehydrogenase
MVWSVDSPSLSDCIGVVGTGSRHRAWQDLAMASLRRIARRRWTNWAGNQQAVPASWLRPSSEAELVEGIRLALNNGRRVRAIGSGHSFTGAAVADETLVDLSAYGSLLRADRATGLVTVQSGIALSALNAQLDDLGLAMPNLGDIAYQTISGAISTGTHGTGARLTGIAGQVRGLRVLAGTGEMVTLNGDDLANGVLGLGALGVITEVTLQCVPSFNLRVVNEPMKVERALDRFEELWATNDHFEFFWVPHTKWALTKTNNHTDAPLSPRPKFSAFLNDYAFENYAFGALVKLGKRRPSLIPRLATAAPSSGRTEFVDVSHRVFTSPRLVKFLEMEYALPIESLPAALREVMEMVDRNGHQVSFPVEVRTAAADDLALSTAFGRASGYIAVHMSKGSPHETYFRDVETIMRAYDGRPHWGKIHTQDAAELSSRYARFDSFLALRDRLDPHGLMTNRYTDTVFGSPARAKVTTT